MTALEPLFACGVVEDPDLARWTAQHAGRNYVLCAPGCKVKFEKNPEHFLQHNPRPGVVHTLCGGEIDAATAEWKAEYQGRLYYFCAATCQVGFEDDPVHYPESYL